MPYKNSADRNANHAKRMLNEPAYAQRCRERTLKAMHIWIAKNPEKHLQKARDWRAADIENARRSGRQAAAKQRKLYPHKTNAHARKAQMQRLLRYPKWADDSKIQAVYEEARIMTEMLGEPWHVDHVIPLQGKLVSGLHVHENLQILSRQDNYRKHNKFEVADGLRMYDS